MVSRSLQGHLPPEAAASAWAVPGTAAAAAPPSAVPSTVRRGRGKCLPDCEVIIVLQT
ncbi:hypothetical protein [Streptomyces phaeolivaceus]|uniref:hypothetical protein n=1 Tax=Streptomyces phaeolivaceus TaxID=2653200 RepID=UPI001D049961|nr:hypothetical protein [Streptomyces phaeolivaceus]